MCIQPALFSDWLPTLSHETPQGSRVVLHPMGISVGKRQFCLWDKDLRGGLGTQEDEISFSHGAGAGLKPYVCLAETCFWGFCGNFFKSKCQRVILGWGFHNLLLPKMPSQGAESIPCYLTSLCRTYQPVTGSWESLPLLWLSCCGCQISTPKTASLLKITHIFSLQVTHELTIFCEKLVLSACVWSQQQDRALRLPSSQTINQSCF